MIIKRETVTLKTKICGYLVDKTTEYNEHGRVAHWYELIWPDDPENPIDYAFCTLKAAKDYAKRHLW